MDTAPPLSTNGFGRRRATVGRPATAAHSGELAVRADLARPATARDRHRRSGSWLVLGDTDLGAELGRGLAAATDRAALRTALDEVDNVLFAPAATAAIDVAAAYALFNEARGVVEELLSLTSPPRLYFLTRNAQPVTDGDRANPTHAVLWGLGRTLALEHPEIWGGVVDVDDSMPAVLTARCVLAEAHAAQVAARPTSGARTRSCTGQVPGTCRVCNA